MAVIEPWPSIRYAYGVETGQIMDGTFEAKCRWMALCDRRIVAFDILQTNDPDPGNRLFEEGHVNGVLFPPKTKQRPLTICQTVHCSQPYFLINHGTGPWMVFDNYTLENEIGERWHLERFPIIQEGERYAGTRQPMAAADKSRR